MPRKNTTVLPISLPPRGSSRDQAAEYVGVGTTKFDDWVDQIEKAGRRLTYSIGKRKLYDRLRIDTAINEQLDSEEAASDDAYALKGRPHERGSRRGHRQASIPASTRTRTGTETCASTSGAAPGHHKVRVQERIGSPEFDQRYGELLAQSDAGAFKPEKQGAPKPRTLRWLARSTRSHNSSSCVSQHRRPSPEGLDAIYAEPVAPGAKETFGDAPLASFTASRRQSCATCKRMCPRAPTAGCDPRSSPPLLRYAPQLRP